MTRLTRAFANHSLLLLYIVGILLVVRSIAMAGGLNYMPPLIIYTFSLLGGYFLLIFLGSFVGMDHRLSCFEINFNCRSSIIVNVLMWTCLGFIVLHFISMGSVPLFDGMVSNDYYDIMRVRQAIFYDVPAFFRYGANLVLKSILPFIAIYYLVCGNWKKSAGAALVGAMYGAALMNKMLIILPIVPLLMFLVLKRRFFNAGLVLAVPVALLGFLVLVQNPHVRPALWTPPELATASGKPMYVEIPSSFGESRSRAKQLVDFSALETSASQHHAVGGGWVAAADVILWEKGIFLLKSFQFVVDMTFPLQQFVETIYLRVFVVPGEVIVAWFDNIPSKEGFGYGCGYRWLASMIGCEYRNFPRLVNDLMLPELASEGIKGTMTAASFMEDYANFGLLGIFFGGFVLAATLWVLSNVYKGQWMLAVSFNTIPLLMLLEMSLSTVMITGGWLITTMLFLLFRQDLNVMNKGLDQLVIQK